MHFKKFDKKAWQLEKSQYVNQKENMKEISFYNLDSCQNGKKFLLQPYLTVFR